MKRSIASYFSNSASTPKGEGDDHSKSNTCQTDSVKKAKNDYQECPFCHLRMAPFSLSMHIADRHRENPIPSPYATPKNPQPRPSQTTPQTSNAFSTMMKASRRSIGKMLFFLEQIGNQLYPHIYMNSETPDKELHLAWSCTVRLRNFTGAIGQCTKQGLGDQCVLTIATNIPPTTLQSDVPIKAISAANVSLLKSMIQKGFRRGVTKKAARLVLELLIRSTEEMLRRLPIIIIEDGLLHAGIPIVVWMMIAQTKGYLSSKWLLSTCVKIFIEACSSGLIDCINYAPNDLNITDVYNLDVEDNATDDSRKVDSVVVFNPCPRRTLLISILLRASYGGMVGDMKLLHSAATIWAYRLFPTVLGVTDIIPAVEHSVLPGYLCEEYCLDIQSTAYGAVCLMSRCYESVETKTSDLDHDCFPEELCTSLELPMLSASYIEEGFDFHCDVNLISHIVKGISASADLNAWVSRFSERESDEFVLENAIKTTIWLFRSSTNTRKLFSIANSSEKNILTDHTSETLSKKDIYSGLWRIICPCIVTYCNEKVIELRERGI